MFLFSLVQCLNNVSEMWYYEVFMVSEEQVTQALTNVNSGQLS